MTWLPFTVAGFHVSRSALLHICISDLWLFLSTLNFLKINRFLTNFTCFNFCLLCCSQMSLMCVVSFRSEHKFNFNYIVRKIYDISVTNFRKYWYLHITMLYKDRFGYVLFKLVTSNRVHKRINYTKDCYKNDCSIWSKMRKW